MHVYWSRNFSGPRCFSGPEPCQQRGVHDHGHHAQPASLEISDVVDVGRGERTHHRLRGASGWCATVANTTEHGQC